MMNISEILNIKYPNASFFLDIILQDDGEGPYIKEWNLDSPKPQKATIEAWGLEEDVIAEYNKQLNQEVNAPIIAMLELIDAKSIRALRVNDAERLAELEAEAVVLRGQLVT